MIMIVIKDIVKIELQKYKCQHKKDTAIKKRETKIEVGETYFKTVTVQRIWYFQLERDLGIEKSDIY